MNTWCREPNSEFENWAVIALGGIPNKVQVDDMGVDEGGRYTQIQNRSSSAATKSSSP
jgi:hypothetical protein